MSDIHPSLKNLNVFMFRAQFLKEEAEKCLNKIKLISSPVFDLEAIILQDAIEQFEAAQNELTK